MEVLPKLLECEHGTEKKEENHFIAFTFSLRLSHPRTDAFYFMSLRASTLPLCFRADDAALDFLSRLKGDLDCVL